MKQNKMDNFDYKKYLAEGRLNEAESIVKKLNKELGYDSNAGTFAEDTFDKDDAEFHGIKPGKYIKFYIEDVENSSILKIKRLAKANGLKFVHDAEDMLLFRESVNESEVLNESLELTPEEKRQLIYILEMKLKNYEETGDEFFAEEMKIVANILNKIK